jgi:hypothetical protein
VVLEYLARIPYQAWEKVAYRAIARSEGRSALAHRIMERVVDARAQHDNEQYHMLIFEDLLRRRGIRLGRLRFRILPARTPRRRETTADTRPSSARLGPGAYALRRRGGHVKPLPGRRRGGAACRPWTP